MTTDPPLIAVVPAASVTSDPTRTAPSKTVAPAVLTETNRPGPLRVWPKTTSAPPVEVKVVSAPTPTGSPIGLAAGRGNGPAVDTRSAPAASVASEARLTGPPKTGRARTLDHHVHQAAQRGPEQDVAAGPEDDRDVGRTASPKDWSPVVSTSPVLTAVTPGASVDSLPMLTGPLKRPTPAVLTATCEPAGEGSPEHDVAAAGRGEGGVLVGDHDRVVERCPPEVVTAPPRTTVAPAASVVREARPTGPRKVVVPGETTAR